MFFSIHETLQAARWIVARTEMSVVSYRYSTSSLLVWYKKTVLQVSSSLLLAADLRCLPSWIPAAYWIRVKIREFIGFVASGSGIRALLTNLTEGKRSALT